MATVNVYVPDDLKERLEGTALNLSAIARECWEAALRREDLPEDEFALEVVNKDEEEIQLRFTGSLLATSGVNGAEVYLTAQDDMIFVDEENAYAIMARERVDPDVLWDYLRDDDAVAEACRGLGIKPIVHL